METETLLVGMYVGGCIIIVGIVLYKIWAGVRDDHIKDIADERIERHEERCHEDKE